MAGRPVMGTVESRRKTSGASSAAGSQQEWSVRRPPGQICGSAVLLGVLPRRGK